MLSHVWLSPANTEPVLWGSKTLAPRQSNNQPAAVNEATPAWADKTVGQGGFFHTGTLKVEK